MNETQRLMIEFTENGSETAFTELVSLHVDLVYSAAVRLAAGDAHTAEDITQTVFTDLARKIPSMDPHVLLGGWLYRHTFYVASKIIRGEHRRRQREQAAADLMHLETQSSVDSDSWQEIEGQLDEAMNHLPERDRNAILLRFFEKQDLRQIGATLGVSDDAAQKCVARAIDKLRGILEGQEIKVSAASLGAVLMTNAVNAAPAAIVSGMSSTALLSAASLSSTTTGISFANIAKVPVAILLFAGVGVWLWFEENTIQMLRAENQKLLAEYQSARQRTAADGAKAKNVSADELARITRDHNELLRLRGEVNLLRQMAQSLNKTNKSAEAITGDVEKRPAQVLISSQFIEAPLSLWRRAGISWAGTAEQSGMLTLEQMLLVVARVERQAGVDILGGPRAVTLDGREAQMSITQSKQLAGNDEHLGPIIQVVPYVSPDGKTVTVKADAKCKQHIGFANGDESKPLFREFSSNAQMALTPGDTLVLASGTAVPRDSEPASPSVLLVFVSALTVDPAGNPLHPVQQARFP